MTTLPMLSPLDKEYDGMLCPTCVQRPNIRFHVQGYKDHLNACLECSIDALLDALHNNWLEKEIQ